MVHRVRWIYPSVVLAFGAVYWLFPRTHPYVVGLVALASVLAVGYGIRTHAPRRANAWRLVGLAVAFAAAGEISYDIFAAGGAVDGYPSVTDALFLVVYAPLSVGLLWLGLPRVPSRDKASIIDTAALSLGGSLVLWLVLIQPTVSSLHLTGLAKTISVAGWVGDAVVLAAAFRLLSAWPQNTAARTLGAAVIALLAGDLLYGIALIDGVWHSGGPVDLCLLVFMALCGGAALMPSMAEIGTAEGVHRVLGVRRLSALAVALLIAPTALLVEATHGPVRTPVAIGVVSAIGGLLAVWRIEVTLKAQRTTVVRDRTVRDAAQRIGLATTTDDVMTAVNSAFGALTRGLPAEAHLSERSVTTPTLTDHGQSLRIPIDTDAVRGPDIAPIDYPDHDLVFTSEAPELAELVDVLVGLAEYAGVALQRIALSEQVRASEMEHDILVYRASHDPLTGLANGELFRRRLRALGADPARHGRTTAVLFIDLDDFKTINDTLGHEAGDLTLVSAAERIQGCVGTDDVSARLGGDEFAALLPDVGDRDAAYQMAERLSVELAEPTVVAGLPVRCRASIGVATASSPEEYPHVMRWADAALYAAKAESKGGWRPYQPNMRSPLHRGNDLRIELQAMLQRTGRDDPAANGLAMHYQPIVDLADGSLRGYEALIRFRHPERGSVPVTDLIAAAEQTGLIVPLGNWALSQAITDAVELTAGSDPPVRYVSVNVSPTQLRQPDFNERVRDAIAAAGLEPTRLVIEMTETQPLDDDDEIWDVLEALSDAGMRIAIDDYGTGHASLGYLRRPVIDILKLDRLFLRDIDTDRTRSLVGAVIQLTKELKIELVAEGIEDHATRIALLGLGCAVGQGHLFAHAMPVGDAIRWASPTYASLPADAAE
ncbi:MAG TPA: bifunctional diguanylate cyclase/phosphodiesterase [Micromonosporaceae bacterium]|nr:bifunctional diguanylate cyclase/phosphodiesterase [Micromonosporaceae bacterium]